MTVPLKIAIIGAGIGNSHLTGYLELPDKFEVRIICDLDETRANGLIERTGAAHYVHEYETVLQDPEIDIVDICLPPLLHFDACRAAMQAGKHVICEKPLVASVRDAEILAEISGKTQKSIFPVFQYRFGLGATQMRALIDAGLAGKPFAGSLETHWNRGTDYYSVDWRGTWKGEQGGAILGHSIHIHDWLSFIFGPVSSVFAELATRVNDIEVEDCAALSIRMDSGAVVTSSVTLGAADDTSRLRFCFEGLTAESGRLPYAPADDTWTFKARAPLKQAAIDELLATIDQPTSGYVGLFEAIHAALNGKPGSQVTLADGRRSLEFVSAVYGSARSGLPVKLPLESTHDLYDGWLP